MADETSISGGAPNTPAAASDTIAGSATPQASGDTVAKPADAGAGQEAKPEAGASAEQKAVEQKVVPERYELKLPDGADLPAEYLEQASALAREYGLSQEQAQKLVERDASLLGSQIERLQAVHAEQVEKWATEVKSDKDLGGDRFEATQTAARAAVSRFGDDGLRALLNESGYGNHPVVVRFFARVGQALSEDNRLLGGNPSAPKRDRASILYPES